MFSNGAKFSILNGSTCSHFFGGQVKFLTSDAPILEALWGQMKLTRALLHLSPSSIVVECREILDVGLTVGFLKLGLP
jgi:hypothetical protein